MANPEHFEILKQGVEVWNTWKAEREADSIDCVMAEVLLRFGQDSPGFASFRLRMHSIVKAGGAAFFNADLSDADLSEMDLGGFDLSGSFLNNCVFFGAFVSATKFGSANLSGADLTACHLTFSDFRRSILSGAILSRANLEFADLSNSVLMGTNLSESHLNSVSLRSAIFDCTRFDRATIASCSFEDIDLRGAIGLESVAHFAPSHVSVDTIFKSEGQIPNVFMRGCGVPDELIRQIPSLISGLQPIQFNSCFISYSHRDEDFAKQLLTKMQSIGLRVWFAPEEMKGGEKLHDQIFSAIQLHDKLLLILSEESMSSEWVATEIRRARRVEREQSRRKLFPIRLVDFERIRQWECFDADSGKDLAIELREYFIPDFSNWNDHDAFEAAFARLLKDLKTEAEKP